MNKEQWKNIDGLNGKYQVSDKGRIRSLCYNKVRILKTFISKIGYEMCNLNGHNYYVHRLVAQEFINNPNNLQEVNHKDENKLNNIIDNLEWCTRKYNVNYGTSLNRRALKTRNNPKISNEVEQYTKSGILIYTFPSIEEAQRITGIYQSNIISVCKGRLQSAGGYVWRYRANKIE